MQLNNELREVILDEMSKISESQASNKRTLDSNKCPEEIKDMLAIQIELQNQNLETLRGWIIKNEAYF